MRAFVRKLLDQRDTEFKATISGDDLVKRLKGTPRSLTKAEYDALYELNTDVIASGKHQYTFTDNASGYGLWRIHPHVEPDGPFGRISR